MTIPDAVRRVGAILLSLLHAVELSLTSLTELRKFRSCEVLAIQSLPTCLLGQHTSLLRLAPLVVRNVRSSRFVFGIAERQFRLYASCVGFGYTALKSPRSFLKLLRQYCRPVSLCLKACLKFPKRDHRHPYASR
jgi:hypothetical protein